MLLKFLLWVLSVVLAAIMVTVNTAYGLVKTIFTGRWTAFGNMYLDLAILIDIYGNVICAPLFNDILRKHPGHHFGARTDTISRVLGINQRDKTLKPLGRALANLLDRIDPGHCAKSI